MTFEQWFFIIVGFIIGIIITNYYYSLINTNEKIRKLPKCCGEQMYKIYSQCLNCGKIKRLG